MASTTETPTSTGANGRIIGEYTHMIIDDTTRASDPRERNYFQPPPSRAMAPRKALLNDIRPVISDLSYSPNDLLKSHGFGVVKHKSAALESCNGTTDLSDAAFADAYYAEIRELVMKTTGAKTVFTMPSTLRRGKDAPEQFKIPDGIAAKGNITHDKAETSQTKPQLQSKDFDKSLNVAKPVRTPHMDFTPLGARQTIRFQRLDINNVAVEAGIIAAEDKICENQPFTAVTSQSNHVIAENYNKNGKLGPRYASYSIWRPTKTVGRDPISLAPAPNTGILNNGDMIHFPYHNRVPGTAELGGDWLKEYALLGVQSEYPAETTSSERDALKWYYLSRQEPDDVLFIKLFDSAALGENAEHAGAPYHASPEIGDVEGSQPRESIDIRVLAFW